MTLDQTTAALAFLQRDVLKHITLLKVLHAYGPAVSCRYLERGGAAGALLMFPPQVFPYDAAAYPFAAQIVLLATSGPAAAEALLDLVPTGQPLVFKAADPSDQAAIARRFAARRVVGFVSYTSPPEAAWPAVAGVAASETLDRRCLELFAAQGHGREELLAHFAGGGALSFAAYAGGEPAAACYIFQNFGPVWEIAGVYTAPAARRAGYGRRVVAAALHALAGRGHTPRYQVHEGNLPSIRLAESLGLRRFVTLEHFASGNAR